MGFWLMPAPESYATGTVCVPNRRDIVPLIEFANRLEHQGLCGEPIFGSPAGRELARPEFKALVNDGAFPSDEALDDFARSINKPSWSLKLQFYGPPEVVKANWQAAQRIARTSLRGAIFTDERFIPLPLSAEDRETVESLAFGIPSLAAFALTARSPWNPEGADGHLFFSPIIPKSGEALLKFQKVMWDEFGKAGFDRQIGPYTVPNSWMFHSFACLAVFLISRSDTETNGKIRTFFHRLIKVAAANGWGEYRTAPMFQDAVRATYNFNDNALLTLQEKLKDAVDPKGILAAGRYGIWPAERRTK
jgi:4-cresol dehydrogenase (hydroxylating)